MLIFEQKYDAIILDFDGTLIDSNEIKAQGFGKLFQDYGSSISDRVMAYHREYVGYSRFYKFKYIYRNILGIKYTNDIGIQLSKKYTEIILKDIINTPLFPKTLDFLKFYHKIILIFIASATPEYELKMIIKQLNLDLYFEGIYGSPRNKIELIDIILTKHNLVKNRVLMVGDSMSDYAGAMKNNIPFIGFKFDDNLSKINRITSINSIFELTDY